MKITRIIQEALVRDKHEIGSLWQKNIRLF